MKEKEVKRNERERKREKKVKRQKEEKNITHPSVNFS